LDYYLHRYKRRCHSVRSYQYWQLNLKIN